MADATGMGSGTGSMNSGGGAGGLDSVIGAADASLSSLDPQQGASAIGQVLQALRGAPGLEDLADNLTELQSQLQSGSPDGAQVGRLLTTLSRQTREAAGQGGAMSGVLNQLAGRLDAAGDKLSRQA